MTKRKRTETMTNEELRRLVGADLKTRLIFSACWGALGGVIAAVAIFFLTRALAGLCAL